MVSETILTVAGRCLPCLLLLAALASCDDEESCSGSECADPCSDLASALAAAEPGAELTAPSCELTEGITVPAGVTLRGPSDGAVTITTASGAALTVETRGGSTTIVEGLTLSSSGSVAILLLGDGDVELRDLQVDASAGFGLVGEGLTRVVAESITISGSIGDVRAVRYPIDPDLFPAIGVALSEIADASLENVDVSGFVGFGAVLSNVDGGWSDSALSDNLGVGALVQGGELSLTEVIVSGTANCPHVSCAASNQVFALAVAQSSSGPTRLDTFGLELRENAGIGYFQDGAQTSTTHQRLSISGNQLVGAWIQNVAGGEELLAFDLDGSDGAIRDNGGAGVVLHSAAGVRLDGATVSGTRVISVGVEDAGTVNMADGIQVIDLEGRLELRDVLIATANEAGTARVGLLVDGAIAENGFVVDGLAIEGSEGLGLLLQNGAEQPADWDVNVSEPLRQNDDAFDGSVDSAAAIGVAPSAGAIAENGLVGPNGLVDEEGALGLLGAIAENGIITGDE